MEYNILLLIGLFFCHFLADYTHLSTPWMLKAKATGYHSLPIFCHALVHGTLMGLLLLFFTNDANLLINLFILQVVTHFSIDSCKGLLNIYFPQVKDSRKTLHWIIFGFDQFLHTLVIILMWYLTLK